MNKSVKKQTLRRVSIAEGHLKKVKKMIEDDTYCPDVIHQSRAVQAALRKVDEIVLDGHLHTCVLSEIRGTKAKKERLAGEIVDLFRKNGK
jgi:DNA-binding FrmR family transcriptional regulator